MSDFEDFCAGTETEILADFRPNIRNMHIVPLVSKIIPPLNQIECSILKVNCLIPRIVNLRILKVNPKSYKYGAVYKRNRLKTGKLAAITIVRGRYHKGLSIRRV